MNAPHRTFFTTDTPLRELTGPRALWYVRCWNCGAAFLPKLGWLGMHASEQEVRFAIQRTR